MTSIFRDEIDAQGNTTRVYADAETVPFVALSGTEMKDFKVKKGDIGFVYNSKTGQSSFFIIAETGPGGGEGSIQLCKNVGIEKINPHPKVGENANKGSDQKTFHYFFFKDSGDGTLKTNAEIESIGQKRLNDSLTN